jgi:transcriptional regulator with XRE-family HTH domain
VNNNKKLLIAIINLDLRYIIANNDIMNVNEFGDRLSAARLNRGITQEQLARASELHQSIISAIENGKRLPTIPQWLQLASALKMPLQWFLTGSTRLGMELPDIAFHLQELGIVDLHVENVQVPGAFRTDAETIALALRGNSPPARIIEAMPAVLAWNVYTPYVLIAFADLYDLRIRYRLGWLADIALAIHNGQGFPGGCPNMRGLENLVGEAGAPEDEDSLGFAKSDAQRPPITIRWKMGYPAPLASFRERAERLHALRLDQRSRIPST